MGRRRRRHLVKPPGTPPGTLVTQPDAAPTQARLIAFGPDRILEKQLEDVQQIAQARAESNVTWIDVNGLRRTDFIQQIGSLLHLHPLAMEDALHVNQRAKVETYEGQIFFVARMVTMNQHLETEQLSLFLGERFVATFQEGAPGDAFEPVRQRLRKNDAVLRRSGADYLAYALLDAVIDAYFPVLEQVGERLEDIEDCILERPTRRVMSSLYDVKRELLTLRRALWPLREALNSLVRDGNPLITPDTRLHLRDCYDHTVRMIDFVETYRELASDLADLYLSSVNQRMTEVMKVLTIIATIFIPLTFISSIYGMNFQTDKSRWNMPELSWSWGYPFALALMAVTAAGMVVYFWRKGWLENADEPRRTGNPAGEVKSENEKDRQRIGVA